LDHPAADRYTYLCIVSDDRAVRLLLYDPVDAAIPARRALFAGIPRRGAKTRSVGVVVGGQTIGVNVGLARDDLRTTNETNSTVALASL